MPVLLDYLKNYHKESFENINMDFLKIDGSHGEGGGQILRSAITISCITKKPIQIENIRSNRKNPGLRPQHLTAIKLLSKICNAKVDGLQVGSSTIKFEPGNVENNSIVEDIGTAGSISLLLQAIIPVVAISKKKLKLSITGGTDVSWSPTSNYTKYVLSEAFSRMGINFKMNILKRGYYPKGGGKVDVEIFPTNKLKPIKLKKRETKSTKLFCSFSKLESQKINEKISSIKDILKTDGFEIESEIIQEDAQDKGGSVLVFSHDSHSVTGSDGLINDSKNDISKRFIEDGLGTDDNLADMLVTPASLINEMSIFTVNKITKHLETNLYVTSKITGSKYGVGKLDDGFEIRVTGNSDTSI